MTAAERFAEMESARAARRPDFDPTHERHRTHPKAKAPTVAFTRTDYAVAKVYDDDDRAPVTTRFVNLTQHEAEAHAGKLRDAMSERDVELALAEGWNYKVVTVRGSHPKAKRVSWKFGRSR